MSTLESPGTLSVIKSTTFLPSDERSALEFNSLSFTLANKVPCVRVIGAIGWVNQRVIPVFRMDETDSSPRAGLVSRTVESGRGRAASSFVISLTKANASSSLITPSALTSP